MYYTGFIPTDGVYTVLFPDLPGCDTEGVDMRYSLFLLAAFLTLTVCFSSGQNMSASQNDRQTAVTVGQTWSVTLPGNPTTGYSWTIARMPDFLELSGEEVYVPAQPQMAGSGGMSTWKFLVIAPGTDTLRFVYRRPWEHDVAPAETVEYNLTARRS